MKEKKPMEQQIAELTPQQKKTIMKIGNINMIILAVFLVIFVLYMLHSAYLRNAREEAFDAWQISSAKQVYLSDPEAHEEKWEAYDEVAEQQEDFLKFSMYFWCGVLVIAIFAMAAIYSHFPFYKDRRYWYLLTHKEQQ